MKKFFNIIPGEDACCILLYGDIGDYDGNVRSGDIARELLEAEALSGRIDVRINSNGGEVYAGIAIFNALKNSKADITIYVDGIAASMASVIALCGKPVQMSRYARLMLHSVQGGCYGNKEEMRGCIREIESLEDTLCEMYAARMGKDKEEIRSLYFDGKDHWLRADEALALGLVNAVYPVEELMDAAMKLAGKIARNAPIAVRATKKAVNEGLQVDMDQAIVIEEKLFGSCFETEDQKNGMTAFLEKRKPEPFVNR